MRDSRTLGPVLLRLLAILLVVFGGLGVDLPGVHGADHGDGPNASNDASGDLNDLYAFLDPNNNSHIVIIVTLRGFIAPGENGNFGQFDHRIMTALEFDLNGDAVAEGLALVEFSPQVSRTTPQTATVTVVTPTGTALSSFTAPTTLSSTGTTAPPQTVTTVPGTSIKFFAGMTDDPFFFDIPGFGAFVASVTAGSPDPTRLARGRDSFAGYNTMAIALSFPRALLPPSVTRLGIGARTFRVSGTFGQPGFTVIEQLDREGVPAVNVALTPFGVKNAYNVASPPQDAAGQFAGGIISTLQALGTNAANINLLASVAVTSGDLLRLDLNTPNSGAGGGSNPAAAFPNGRRLRDDVIDTLLAIITNGAITTGDNVNANEKSLQDEFPFLALPHQPFPTGTTDDLTRN